MPDTSAITGGVTANLRPSKRWRIVALTVAIVIIIIVSVVVLLIESRHFIEIIRLSNGESLDVQHDVSKWRYFSMAHVGGIGGGLISHVVSFEYRNARWKFHTRYDPIALHPEGGRVYLIVFDRETDFSKCRFRFYEALPDSEPLEIAADQYPKPYAIQNMWLSHGNGFVILPGGKKRIIDEYDIVTKLDTNDVFFGESLTARLWQRLELGLEYYVTEGIDSDPAFLEEYKRKYIGAKTSRPAP